MSFFLGGVEETNLIHIYEFSGWWFQIFFYVQPYLGNISNLTNIFQVG